MLGGTARSGNWWGRCVPVFGSCTMLDDGDGIVWVVMG